MDSNELKALIAQKNLRDKMRAEKEENKMQDELGRYAKMLEPWNVKIREWIENISILKREGYEISSPLYYKERSRALKEKVLLVCTDGVYHGFGFFQKDHSKMGVEEGGACGEWNIVTNGFKWWLQERNTAQTKEMSLQAYKQLFYKRDCGNGKVMNKFEIFEARMNEVYDYLRS